MKPLAAYGRPIYVPTEAESVAYIVAAILGLDTSAYSVEYVAGWGECDAATIKATAANVLGVAHRIADAIVTMDAQSADALPRSMKCKRAI